MIAPPRLASLCLALACAALASVVVANAWVCDDAYITLRTADNFVHGHGLRWNVAERVQTFTHPLWLFVLSAGYFVTREPYYTTLALSLAATTIAIAVLVRHVASSRAVAAVAILALAFSKAFVDFSTSGLENPLTHVLLLAFVAVWLRQPDPERSLRPLCVLAGLAVLNRMDAGLLLVPALAARAARARWNTTAKAAGLGFLPFGVWEAFSLLYYGSLVPNTAYAKLGTGEGTGELLALGASYFANTAVFDPLTAVAMAGGLAGGLVSARLRWLAAGLVLYGAYVLRIGGDFMSGRFFAAPFTVAVALLAALPVSRLAVLVPAALAIVGLGLVPRSPTVRAETASTADAERWAQRPGIVDERLFYSEWAGLRQVFPGRGVADTPRGRAGERMRARGGVRLHAAVGYFGYHAGPAAHLYDLYALADPLLARLPARRDIPQRIGHYMRVPPTGYADTLRTGDNAIVEPSTRRLHEDLHLVTRGDLLLGARLAAIWRLHTGAHAAAMAKAPPLDYVRVPLARLAAGKNPGPVSFSHAGLIIEAGRLLHPEAIELAVSADDSHQIYVFGERYLLAIDQAEAIAVDAPGHRTHRLEIAPAVRERGIVRLLVIPYEGDDAYSVAWVGV